MERKYFIFLLTVLLTSCDQKKSTKIPFSSEINIRIDGVFDAEDWNSSKIIQLTPNNSLYLIQNKDYLFMGIYNNENVGRYVDMYLYNESLGTVNLHASMQLAERQLIGNWNDTIPAWNWGNNRDWISNKVEVVNDNDEIPFLESVKPYQGHEFQISKRN